MIRLGIINKVIAMLTRIQLENFKSWRELDIELAPLTMLFGANSSGKSSVLQALLLLLQTEERTTWESINMGGGVNDYVDLGSYRDIVFGHDLTKKIWIALGWNNQPPDGLEMEYKNDEIDFDVSDYLVDWFVDLSTNIVNRESSIHYLGPLRQHPQRSYLWSGATPKRIEPDGENAVAALVSSERSKDDVHKQVAEWLVRMELVDAFATKSLDSEKRFYETVVKIGATESALLDVGFGISQVLPVITTLFFVPEGSTVLLEQPELHLHPRAQAHLADLFLHVAETRKLQLIVESHSEHLLRRLQRRIAEAETPFASPENIKMYFCEKGKNGSTIQKVEVDSYGQIQNWPEGFFGDITGDLEKMAVAALQRPQNGG